VCKGYAGPDGSRAGPIGGLASVLWLPTERASGCVELTLLLLDRSMCSSLLFQVPEFNVLVSVSNLERLPSTTVIRTIMSTLQQRT